MKQKLASFLDKSPDEDQIDHSVCRCNYNTTQYNQSFNISYLFFTFQIEGEWVYAENRTSKYRLQLKNILVKSVKFHSGWSARYWSD